ncbi:hypothetical protein [Amycolatopsis keratiniphila]|uniref:hypothetical protein n=1 Tax=Amycolatopsis keratiniphila TaxID=129921 RepID=UPI00190FA716|nr:hypothetical protein [Amycolatopsis keratiniphila]
MRDQQMHTGRSRRHRAQTPATAKGRTGDHGFPAGVQQRGVYQLPLVRLAAAE